MSTNIKRNSTAVFDTLCSAITITILFERGYLTGFIYHSDIDECVEADACHADAVCTNANGSYTCQCREGYTGNGMLCEGRNLDFLMSFS